MKAAELFTLDTDWIFQKVLRSDLLAWEWLPLIGQALESIDFGAHQAQIHMLRSLSTYTALKIEGRVFIHKSVKLPHYGTIQGPCWIGANTELRPGIFIRGNVIVGENCILGNACEFKNCVLLNQVQVPHFNYVGDSILGNKAHLGAGAVLANLRLDQKPIAIQLPQGHYETGLRKFGAILADEAEVGCNAVLQPGTILDKNAKVFPTLAYRGYLAKNAVAKRSNVAER